jgi:hypothetical protein
VRSDGKAGPAAFAVYKSKRSEGEREGGIMVCGLNGEGSLLWHQCLLKTDGQEIGSMDNNLF